MADTDQFDDIDRPEQPDAPRGAPLEEDQRRHPRKPFRMPVRLTYGKISGESHARDMSLSGIFVETSEPIFPGQNLQLFIPFSNQDRHIKIKGKVVRVTDDGVGVQFDVYSIDIE